MSVRLQEYVEVGNTIQQGVFLGSPTAAGLVSTIARAVTDPGRTIHVVLEGDTLSAIAGLYLGDPGRWREIAQANAITDPFSLVEGIALVISTTAPAPGYTRRAS